MINKSFVFILFLSLMGCIETDIQAPLTETFRIKGTENDIRVTGTYLFETEYTDRDGVIQDVDPTWTSSNPAILEFNGISASAKSGGTVMITATLPGLNASREIMVKPSQESVMISMFRSQMSIDDTFTFGVNYLNLDGENMVANTTWTSSNEAVATINSEGLVTAITEGQTTIGVSAGLVSDELTLTVIEGEVVMDPEIRFVQFDTELVSGNSFQYNASYFGADGNEDTSQTITWSSDNTSVITIDQNGFADALSAGSATITASANGIEATLTVSVVDGDVIRTGMLQGTGYDISGNFKLELDNNGELILTVESYEPDGPGPYFYLTNSTTNVSNGLNLGAAPSSGDYVINVSEIASAQSLEINIYTYDVLMVWCEPFGVRLGFGEFDN